MEEVQGSSPCSSTKFTKQIKIVKPGKRTAGLFVALSDVASSKPSAAAKRAVKGTTKRAHADQQHIIRQARALRAH